MSGNQHTRGWTEEQDAELRKLVGEGKSSTQIARAMARLRPGVTRNGVIGYCARLGLRLPANKGGPAPPTPSPKPKPKPKPQAAKPTATPSAKPVNRNAERTREKVVTIAPPPAPEPVRPDAWAPLPGVKPIMLMERRLSQCPWPVGEPAEPRATMCCGAPRQGDAYYCSTHMAMRRGKPWRERASMAS